MNHKSLGIYIHIPFCVRKCLYCDFVSGPASLQDKKDYVNCLLNEIEMRAKELQRSGTVIDTVFIGGGTPSVIDAEDIVEILCKLKSNYRFAEDCECSIEVNPGTVDFDKLKKYREAGMNRLSIGLQSCNNNELKALGRIHDYSAFEETYRLARKAGFENINVDLMSAIPEQTEDSFIHSLKRVAQLNPEHISVYSLIVEEGTPFYNMDLNIPDEDTERKIYHMTAQILEEYGYSQYEISNYAKPGMECRHNIRYWQCDEYIGFGVAAASYLNDIRWKNTEDMHQYMSEIKRLAGVLEHSIEGPVCFEDNMYLYCEREILTPDDKCAEFMFMGLRMNEGVSENEFMKRFGCRMDEKYADVIEEHIENGLLWRDKKRIGLTPKGRDVSNYVMAEFLF